MAWTDYIVNTGNVAGIAFIILLALAIIALLVWWIIRTLRYNKRVVVRVITGGGSMLIQTDLAKEYKDKRSGATYWRLKRRKHIIPRPQPRAVSITRKGKEWTDLYYTGQGQYVPAITSKPEFSEDKAFIQSFHPITESQRASYVDQIEKAQAYKTKGLTELLRDAVPYIALVMIISVFLLFLSEGMAPIIKQAEIASAGAKDFIVASEIMREAVQQLRGIQVVGGQPNPSIPANFTPPD